MTGILLSDVLTTTWMTAIAWIGWGLRGKPGEERDIAEQLQIATELQTDKRDLERLCGDAKLEILRLRRALAKAVEVFDWQRKQPDRLMHAVRQPEYVDEMRALVR